MEKDLIIRVFNNKLLHTKVFSYVSNIYSNLYYIDKTYKYNEMIINPEVMAGNNYLDLLIQYDNTHDDYSKSDVLINAIKVGSLDIVKHYFENNINNLSNLSPDLMFYATKYNEREIIKYLYSYSKDSNINNSINNENDKLVAWDFVQSLTVSPVTRSLDIVQLMSNRVGDTTWKLSYQLYSPSNPFDMAASVGAVDIIDWLIKNRPTEVQYTRMYYSAVFYNQFEVLQYLFENGIPYIEIPSIYLMNLAIAGNRLEIVKLLHQHSVGTISDFALDLASLNQEMAMWLHQNFPNILCTENFTLDILRNGCNESSLEMFRWYSENRPEGFGSRTVDFAAAQGQLELLNMIKLKQPEMTCSVRAINEAARLGLLDVVKWLHSNVNGVQCTVNAMDSAAKNGLLEVVQWLHFKRTEGCTTYAMDYAPSVELLQWLHDNRTEGCTTEASKNAVNCNRPDLLLWLYKNKPGYVDPASLILMINEHHTPSENSLRDHDAVFQLLLSFCNTEKLKYCLNEIKTHSPNSTYYPELIYEYLQS